MEYSIMDVIAGTPGYKKAIEQNRELFKEALETRYTFRSLSVFNITREEAIKINLGDVKTINKVYFDNIETMSRFAWYFQRERSTKGNVYRKEDILQQFYVDIRYYDFKSDTTLKKCITRTCLTSNNGGILASKAYRSERKPVCFLYDQISAHNSKMEDGAFLIDFIQADERKTNPEQIQISKEEPKKYTSEMQRQLLSVLNRSQRKKFIEAFGGEV